MATQTVHSTQPLLPMPELKANALRSAVAQLLPSRLPEFDKQMADFMTMAQAAESLGPVRTFLERWGLVIAIERHPDRAARMHRCEQLITEGGDPDEERAALSEISRILAEAHREIGK